MFILGDTSNTNDTRRQDLAWPDTAYQGVRVAANARFYLWSFLQVGAEGAYRLVTNPGEGGLRVRSPYYFPNGKTTFGFEGSAFASVGIVSSLRLAAASTTAATCSASCGPRKRQRHPDERQRRDRPVHGLHPRRGRGLRRRG